MNTAGKSDFEANGYQVRIGAHEWFNYTDVYLSEVVSHIGLKVTIDEYWFFVGPDGFLWHYPADPCEQRDWKQEGQNRCNVANWTKWHLEAYPDNSGEWRENTHIVNEYARANLQAKYDEVLNRVSLVKFGPLHMKAAVALM